MGPSYGKLLLDLLLAIKTLWWLVAHGPWHLVHVHEEAAFWATPMRALLGTPVLYDRHSSLARQLASFGRGGMFARWIFSRLERFALRRSDGVIVISPELEEEARRIAPGVAVQLIENLAIPGGERRPSETGVRALRSRFALDGHRTVVYTGSFGVNQGLELAIDAVPAIVAVDPTIRLVLVGGGGSDLERVRSHARQRGVEGQVVFTGAQPYTAMPDFMALADVLLSPRHDGTSTPLKIYSYLSAGKPIVATDVPAHTDLLSSRCAELVPPRSADLAAAIVRVLSDRDRARSLADESRRFGGELVARAGYDERLAAILTRACGDGRRDGG